MLQALAWKEDHLELLDQTRLPGATVHLQLRRAEEVFEAIQRLRVRGAPAIGIAAAYALYLAVREESFASPSHFFEALRERSRYLASARPTAVNLSWALQEVEKKLEQSGLSDPATLKQRLLQLAAELHEDDRRRCDSIAEHGQAIVPQSARILTHCNTEALATGGIGTAFGVIYQAQARGKKIRVFVDETRPLLQGARLTMFELASANIPSQLICDNMAAALMQQGGVDLVIVGADRITADGSAANKIGTYGLAVAARYHGIPFYIAAPLSTFDLSLAHGREIPIENRQEEEVWNVLGKCQIAPTGVACWNPAFDVTPPELITALITEQGLIYPPYRQNILAAS